MHTCLVVANQTVGGEEFSTVIQDRVRTGNCDFYVVVPATPAHDLVASYAGSGAGTTKPPSAGDLGRSIAEQRLAAALAEIRGAGGAAEGEVGDPDPIEAVRDALRNTEADEIIVSTLSAGLSKWLRRGLPSQLEREFGLPITHVASKDLTTR